LSDTPTFIIEPIFHKYRKSKENQGVIRVFGIAQITPFCIYQIFPFLCLLDDVAQGKPI